MEFGVDVGTRPKRSGIGHDLVIKVYGFDGRIEYAMWTQDLEEAKTFAKEHGVDVVEKTFILEGDETVARYRDPCEACENGQHEQCLDAETEGGCSCECEEAL